MKYNDILLELDRIKAQLQALELSRINTMKQMVSVMQKMQIAVANEDYYTLRELNDKADLLMKQADMLLKLIDKTKAETRRVCVTVYGPAGGIVYDQLLKEMEGSGS